jgi:hypothetical protein
MGTSRSTRQSKSETFWGLVLNLISSHHICPLESQLEALRDDELLTVRQRDLTAA